MIKYRDDVVIFSVDRGECAARDHLNRKMVEDEMKARNIGYKICTGILGEKAEKAYVVSASKFQSLLPFIAASNQEMVLQVRSDGQATELGLNGEVSEVGEFRPVSPEKAAKFDKYMIDKNQYYMVV